MPPYSPLCSEACGRWDPVIGCIESDSELFVNVSWLGPLTVGRYNADSHRATAPVDDNSDNEDDGDYVYNKDDEAAEGEDVNHVIEEPGALDLTQDLDLGAPMAQGDGPT